MPAPEVLVFSTLGVVILIAALILWFKGRQRPSHGDELVRLDARLSVVEKEVEADDEFEPAYESEHALSSIESIELLKDIEDDIEFAEDSEDQTEESDFAAEDSFSGAMETEIEPPEAEVPPIEEEVIPESKIESVAEVADEKASDEAAPTGEESHSVEAIMAAAEEIQAEVDTLASTDEDLRRATLRRAPHRHRRPRTIDENLDTQITELDQRLDALEALVSSIEQGLADFEPLLEDVDATPANGGDAPDSENGHAQAA
ncbi:MAG: hypothetical protein KDN19_16410 [Verrucomicrobiae bacterium]|nr:hypothetical protein [Verrucomicrobiae bacterium]